MDELANKLKTNALISLILGLLSITWLVVDYFVLQTVLENGLTKFSLEWILLIFSGAALILFHISVFITLFNLYRFLRKYRKQSKNSRPLYETAEEGKQIGEEE